MSNLPLLLGHRGARAARGVAENTLASFDLALEHGCDGFEFDVRLAACGSAVVVHDPRVRGITVSRAKRQQLLDLPLLDEVVQRYGSRAFLDIELKVQGLGPAVLDILSKHRPRQYVISSFIPAVVTELRALDNGVPLGIICEKRTQLSRWRQLGVTYVIAHHSLVNRKLLQDVHSMSRKLFTWTVNDRDAMLRLAEWDVDGIISDDTQLLVATLKRD